MTPVQTKRALVRIFEEVLQKAARERKDRQDFVQDPCETRFTYTVPGWVLFERNAMFRAVNDERRRRGFPLIEVKNIDRVERLACGHVDYATKYPLYCAEIALGENEPQP